MPLTATKLAGATAEVRINLLCSHHRLTAYLCPTFLLVVLIRQLRRLFKAVMEQGKPSAHVQRLPRLLQSWGDCPHVQRLTHAQLRVVNDICVAIL